MSDLTPDPIASVLEHKLEGAQFSVEYWQSALKYAGQDDDLPSAAAVRVKIKLAVAKRDRIAAALMSASITDQYGPLQTGEISPGHPVPHREWLARVEESER